MKVRIAKSQLSSKDNNYFSCEGCHKDHKIIYLVTFGNIHEIWLCPECIESLRDAINGIK